MIGHPILRKIVGADALGAIAGADLRFTLGGVFGSLFFLLFFEQAGTENANCDFLIAMLGALCL